MFLQRKHSAVSGVKQEAQEILGEGERLLDEANQLSDNLNKEIEVLIVIFEILPSISTLV